MSGVGIEGINEPLSEAIQLSADLLHLCVTHVLQVFQFDTHRGQHQIDVLHGQMTRHLGEVSLQTTHHRITHVG